jgi:uncharacterized protein (TIGR02246 family)
MPRSIRLTFFIAVSLFGTQAIPSVALPQSREESAIRQRLDDWLKALERGDLAALNEIIAPDYVITVSDGRLLNREQDLAPVKAGMRFKSAKIDSVQIRILGETAIVTGHGTYEVGRGDRTMRVQERFSDVWAKREGRWHPVASASVGLKPPVVDSTGRAGAPPKPPS